MAILVILVVASLAAFLTDHKTVTNTFTIGNVEIELTEPSWNSENGIDIAPGAVIAKDPTIKNIGVNDAYVFAKITVPVANVTISGATEPAKTQLFTYSLKDGWVEVGNATETDSAYVHVYAWAAEGAMTTLAKDATTSPVFDSVTFADLADPSEVTGELQIVVDAYAIQSDCGETAPADVWALFGETPEPGPTPETEYKEIGGKVFYDAGVNNGLTYTFYDADEQEITYTNIASLENAKYYSTTGTRTDGSGDRFYVLGTDGTGAALTVTGTWGPTETAGGTANTIGAGKTNTATLLGKYKNTDNTIWKALEAKEGDWFIGSEGELSELQKSTIASSEFTSDIWTSTEVGENTYQARCWYNSYSQMYLDAKNITKKALLFTAF